MEICDIPVGSVQKALDFPFFPAKHLAVIWHNWNLVAPARIAEVLETSEANVIADAEAMGLIRDDSKLEQFASRGYQTVIRTNWHLLDYEQMLKLLSWTADKLAFTLKEDDFLWVKLGCMKPSCGKVVYRELTAEEKARVAEIAQETAEIRKAFPAEIEPHFAFLDNYGKMESLGGGKADGLRLIYSYSAVYGDPFMDEKVDPYPDGLLKDYAAAGINAVWLPGLLYTLIPWVGENLEISKDWEKRLAGVRRIADRCAKYGIRLYLYLNEPRSLPKHIADQTPWGGSVTESDGSTALCPWAPGLLEAFSAGIERLCREVPTLGGFFTITMSENLTHCLARSNEEMSYVCPRCAEHTKADNVAKVLEAIYKGIKAAGSDAKVVAWTWAWKADWAVDVLKQLPKDIMVMCVSETNVETNVLGHKGTILDYSLSKPGPGPDAKVLWKLGRDTGHPCVAKIQVNTSWEMSAVPTVQVPFLVKQHLDALKAEGIKDFMMSWTLGGCPGGNMPLMNMSVEELAERKFGKDAAAMLEIWKIFSDAFAKIPFDVTDQIYKSPQNIGAANLLFKDPTGYQASMVRGFPYDDLKGWCGSYPEEIFEEAFRIVADEWKTGLDKLEKLDDTPALKEQKILAETTWTCLRSTYLQTHFIRLRNAGKISETIPLIREDIELAKMLIRNYLADSRIGFEATNHYFYTINELMEKIIASNYLIKQIG
ncbi:MAG: hypothetical protein IJW23_05515 [Lentisphaeria bacterium]|nr:hypothetical protein [Lentisphaeria bacterium]